MYQNGNRERKILLATGLVVCFLISSLLSTVLSLESRSSVVGSKGSIAYAPSAILLVTDSTPEGPVPYKIDEGSGYQTGSTYNISAGGHTIELPSPYTSSISNITYYFSQWQDGSTDNPRAVTLEADTTTSLHGLYSTSPEPPPPPPPPDGGYFAYNGWEHLSVGTNWGRNRISDWTDWEDGDAANGGYNCQYNPVQGTGYAEVASSFTDSYGYSPPNMGSKVLKFVKDIGSGTSSGYRFHWNFMGYFTTHPMYYNIYQTYWIYFPSPPTWYGDSDWWDYFWQLKEFPGGDEYGANREIGIEIEKSASERLGGSSTRWRIYVMKPDTGSGVGEQADYRIYADHTVEVNKASQAIVAVPSAGFDVPLARWFRLEIYLHRTIDYTGVFKVWITDPNNQDPSRRGTTILFSAENVRTILQSTSKTEYLWMYARGTTGYYYIDEIYIYNYNAHSVVASADLGTDINIRNTVLDSKTLIAVILSKKEKK